MRAVGIKVLKAKLSEYVRLAKAGETILVTERDEVVAEAAAGAAAEDGAESRDLARRAGGARRGHIGDEVAGGLERLLEAPAPAGSDRRVAARRLTAGSMSRSVYLETSALLRSILGQDGGAEVTEELVSAHKVVTSRLTQVEADRASFA